jgi:hypothetical protein
MKVYAEGAHGDEERDAEKLARHKHARIRATHQEIARSLEGALVPGVALRVGASLELYDTSQEKIQFSDQRIDEHLRALAARVNPLSTAMPEPARRGKGVRPRLSAPASLRPPGPFVPRHRVDLTQIDVSTCEPNTWSQPAPAFDPCKKVLT